MSFTVEIKRIGEDGMPSGRAERFRSQTVTGAIDLARMKLLDVSRAAHPLSVDIFDYDKRLVMSYHSRPKSPEIY